MTFLLQAARLASQAEPTSRAQARLMHLRAQARLVHASTQDSRCNSRDYGPFHFYLRINNDGVHFIAFYMISIGEMYRLIIKLCC